MERDPNAERSSELDPDLTQLVASVMERYVVPGLALGLFSDGREFLRGFGVSIENPLPVDADTIFVAGSITKTVVATTVTVLVDRKTLKLTQPIRFYLPDLQVADELVASTVTMRHLMTHTAGWVGDDYEGTEFGPGDDALERAVAAFRDRPQILPVGSLWSDNSAFWLAGRVIEIVTGTSLEAAIGELVFRPLGMTCSFFFEADAITRRIAVGHNPGENGVATVVRPWSTPRAQHAAGGMLTTITDLMTFARFHLGDGCVADGSRVLGTEALRSMQEPLVQAVGSEYAGIGWVVRDVAGHRVISHGGDWNGQQGLITLVPDRGLAIASLANSGQARSGNDAIAAWALRRYLGAADPQPIPVEQADDRLDALVGRYVLPDKTIDVLRSRNRLGITYRPTSGQAMAGQAFPEQPAALTLDGRIVLTGGPFDGITGDFLVGPDGMVSWIRLGGRVYPRQRGAQR